MPLSCSPFLAVESVSLFTYLRAKPSNSNTLIVYLLLGLIAIASDRSTLWNIPGYLGALIGIAYIVLEFIPSIEPPANMRDADAGWGAEQV
jgi:hypothetical protein